MVTDLFEDIKDGVILLALLEVLSGQKLVSFKKKKTFINLAVGKFDIFFTLNFEPNRKIFGLHFTTL